MSSIHGSRNGIGNEFFKCMLLHILSKKNNLKASYNFYDKFKKLGIDFFVDGANQYNDTITLTDNTFFNCMNTPINKNVELQGYFQTRDFAEYLKRYFTENDLFEPVKQANPYKDRYNTNNDMFIHVRLTDAAKHNHGPAYYDHVISKIQYTTGYISSDDIRHPICQYLIHKYNLNVYDSKVVDTIQFASTCKHLVLSNGTFSWLIGFLAFYSSIYYPQPDLQHVWFGDIFIFPEWKSMNYTTEYISLGWDCSSAMYGVEKGLRKTKVEGYKTCPFDLITTNYKGIVECFEDDFESLCDLKYIELKTIKTNTQFLNYKIGEEIIIHTKYNFIFNHESVNPDLARNEKWEKGPYHFCLNNFEHFVNRYNSRIQNFKNYLNSGKKIIFILTKMNCTYDGCKDLSDIIKIKYPNLDFDFHFIELPLDRYNIYNEYNKFIDENNKLENL